MRVTNGSLPLFIISPTVSSVAANKNAAIRESRAPPSPLYFEVKKPDTDPEISRVAKENNPIEPSGFFIIESIIEAAKAIAKNDIAASIIPNAKHFELVLFSL